MDQVGFEAIRREAWQVSGYLIDGLKELGADLAPCVLRDDTRSTIVSFSTPDPQQTYQYLRGRDIACSLRCGLIRMGIHGYNTTQEADQVLEVLRPHLAR